MSAITGLPSPTMKVPHAVAMAFAFFDETITGKLWARNRGRRWRRCGCQKDMFASSAKAERELGFKVRRFTMRCVLRLSGSCEWLCAAVSETDAERGAMKVGIIAALPREVSTLVKGWEARELAVNIHV